MTNQKRPTRPKTLARARKLRRDMTRQERKLWNALRGKRLYGIKFRRQHPFPPYILDFYCHQHKLVVELDGSQHAEVDQEAYDHARTAWLEAQGLQVVRFSNYDVERNLEGVLNMIAEACGVDVTAPQTRPPSVPSGGGK